MKPLKTILLVDDDREDQEIFELVVNEIDQSYDCVCVDNAEDALQLLQKYGRHKPDYIFLDLNLPYMSGFDCLNAIKHEDELKEIPVIVYSTSSRMSDITKAKALGAHDYLTKANTYQELKTKLSELVN